MNVMGHGWCALVYGLWAKKRREGNRYRAHDITTVSMATCVCVGCV